MACRCGGKCQQGGRRGPGGKVWTADLAVLPFLRIGNVGSVPLGPGQAPRPYNPRLSSRAPGPKLVGRGGPLTGDNLTCQRGPYDPPGGNINVGLALQGRLQETGVVSIEFGDQKYDPRLSPPTHPALDNPRYNYSQVDEKALLGQAQARVQAQMAELRRRRA